MRTIIDLASFHHAHASKKGDESDSGEHACDEKLSQSVDASQEWAHPCQDDSPLSKPRHVFQDPSSSSSDDDAEPDAKKLKLSESEKIAKKKLEEKWGG